MRLGRTALILGYVCLLAFLQLLATLTGLPASLLCAFVIGSVGIFGIRFFHLGDLPAFVMPILLITASLLGTATAWMTGQVQSTSFFSVLLTIVACSVTMLLQTMHERRCLLCKRRLLPRALSFTCPRCGLSVCEEHCWTFEYRRCQLCVEQRVSLLPVANDWWNRALGPVATYGRCQVCMTSTETCSVRHCGQCRRLQCHDCWDNLNGECVRCGWTMPNLPDSLKFIVTAVLDKYHEVHQDHG